VACTCVSRWTAAHFRATRNRPSSCGNVSDANTRTKVRVYGEACPTVQMDINPPKTALLHTLLTAMRWIACHGLFIAQVAVRDAFRLWIDAVNILNKQGLLSFLSLSLSLFAVRATSAKCEVCMGAT